MKKVFLCIFLITFICGFLFGAKDFKTFEELEGEFLLEELTSYYSNTKGCVTTKDDITTMALPVDALMLTYFTFVGDFKNEETAKNNYAVCSNFFTQLQIDYLYLIVLNSKNYNFYYLDISGLVTFIKLPDIEFFQNGNSFILVPDNIFMGLAITANSITANSLNDLTHNSIEIGGIKFKSSDSLIYQECLKNAAIMQEIYNLY